MMNASQVCRVIQFPKFGGGDEGGSRLDTLAVLTVCLALQPGIDARSLAMSLRVLSEEQSGLAPTVRADVGRISAVLDEFVPVIESMKRGE